MAHLRIGSRGSQLALWQANHIGAELQAQGHTVAIEVIRTTGDRMQDPGFLAPAGVDGRGIFIKEIEEALASGLIDLAVHSYKDLPTTLDERFTIAAVPPRADARDAFVCEAFWGLHTLPDEARVGTNSPRRRAQLLAMRPDLRFVELRGNVDTRLRKLEEGQCEALVLACAGLDRIGRAEAVHQRFELDELTPAPGQGALALETRSPAHALDTEDARRDPEIFAAIRALEHPVTRFATDAERAFLARLGGGCELPLGAHCLASGLTSAEMYRMYAQVLSPDGEQMVQTTMDRVAAESAEEFGERVAEVLIGRGALELLMVGVE